MADADGLTDWLFWLKVLVPMQCNYFCGLDGEAKSYLDSRFEMPIGDNLVDLLNDLSAMKGKSYMISSMESFFLA